MFRFSIRELLLVTLMVGMGTAWGMEHRAMFTVRQDAEYLARYGVPSPGCFGDDPGWILIARKYYGPAGDERRLIIVSEDEAKLGLNTDTP